MYVLNWDPNSQTIEASFGGRLTPGECAVFLDELRERSVAQGSVAKLFLDFGTVRDTPEHVESCLSEARAAGLFAGAEVTVVARDEDTAHRLTNERLQEVLEGRERYVAYRMAA